MLSWPDIVRLGLVQMALGSIVVLTTSTLNRVMVVELALPAVLPGLLVALHYGVQISRPSWGFASDRGGNRTRWILRGMALLALGALAAAGAVWLFSASYALGLAVSVVAFAMIGLGVGAAGTSLLALLAVGAPPERRAAAAMITWLMMIAGIALTAGGVGAALDPYAPPRLLAVVAIVVSVALGVTCLAARGVERRLAPVAPPSETISLRAGVREVWAEPQARAFGLFVLLSMVAYFMQELILEPFAGLAYGLTPGQTTALSGAQNGGVFAGMLAVGIAASALRIGSLRGWVVAGCLMSAAALATLAGLGRTQLPLVPVVIGLGFANGVFAVAAIGAMMQFAGEGRARREGTRMGLWGAAQAMAAGFGGLLGAALADGLRLVFDDRAAFGAVFLIEAGLFVAAAGLALRIMGAAAPAARRLVPGE